MKTEEEDDRTDQCEQEAEAKQLVKQRRNVIHLKNALFICERFINRRTEMNQPHRRNLCGLCERKALQFCISDKRSDVLSERNRDQADSGDGDIRTDTRTFAEKAISAENKVRGSKAEQTEDIANLKGRVRKQRGQEVINQEYSKMPIAPPNTAPRIPSPSLEG